jgi:hypothetical protein
MPAEDIKTVPALDDSAVVVPGFYSEKRALEIVFPDPVCRPSPRTWARWKSQRLFSYRKIGGKIAVDPQELRRGIDRLFTVKASV